MLNEIQPHEFDNRYVSDKPSSNSSILCFDGKMVLLKRKSDVITLPSFQELKTTTVEKEDKTYTYLFKIDQENFYLTYSHEEIDEYSWEPVTSVLRMRPRHLAFAILTAYQLSNWYRNNKFCGTCGNEMSHADNTRAMYCKDCDRNEYPLIAPAVLIGIKNEERLLMARYPNYDKYALLAGFVEIGETLEECVKREVQEEVGLKIKNINYYKSQPSALGNNLMVGFYCDLEGSDKIMIDKAELASALWIEKNHIPLDESYDDGSLTTEMIQNFKQS